MNVCVSLGPRIVFVFDINVCLRLTIVGLVTVYDEQVYWNW